MEEHKVLNELYFIRNPKTSKIAADILSFKHAVSPGWLENFEKVVPTADDNYKHQVVQNLNYLKLKHIEILMKENQENLKMAETEEDIIISLGIQSNLQEFRKKITDQIGNVIR